MDALSYSAAHRSKHLNGPGGGSGDGFFFELLQADAGATGVDIRREGHSAAQVLRSFTASQKRTTRWFFQAGFVTQILGALMHGLRGVISSACDRKLTRVPPQFAQQQGVRDSSRRTFRIIRHVMEAPDVPIKGSEANVLYCRSPQKIRQRGERDYLVHPAKEAVYC
ncbi:hypothetical protein CORC01_10400 [Colletotrichum orchidophilum]|uniref:Uncharacterized protein n=1 Tax=Colletotrichum orchidophilum TaxID=1209926 RepID=A0A1G4AZ44_9PEZI|nr:uncharacterized protein CORC01_10400 [Colletotrichum orchidophilum]OHE94353.1 hypothetical protein CORC01_10400 [Colletotrichum orchidophilum]